MIEVKNLVKRYGENTAVKGVSFTVEDGHIYGFLGPNGAGKSTTMNIITGCLAATEGEVKVDGHDIYDEPVEAKACIGYLPEQPPLYTDMTPAEYLEFVGRAKGLSGEKLYKAVDEVIAKTGLGEYSNRLISKLSKGYRQRVGIAQAIIGNPKIVILDEPTVGLDPRQIIEIRDLIRELGKEHTVILSSHILTEISAVCDYVIIIAHGKIAASDTLENLIKLYEGKNYVDITVRGNEEQIKKLISSASGVMEHELTPAGEGLFHVRIAVEKGRDIREELFFGFAERKMPILSMEYEETTLEKVFLELTSDKNIQPADISDKSDTDTSDTSDKVTDADGGETDVSRKPAQSVETDEAGKADKADAPSDDDYKPLFGSK